VRRSQVYSLQRGDLVLDVVTGVLLEFLWLSGTDGDAPRAIQLRPMSDSSDYSWAITFREATSWQYVRLEPS